MACFRLTACTTLPRYSNILSGLRTTHLRPHTVPSRVYWSGAHIGTNGGSFSPRDQATRVERIRCIAHFSSWELNLCSRGHGWIQCRVRSVSLRSCFEDGSYSPFSAGRSSYPQYFSSACLILPSDKPFPRRRFIGAASHFRHRRLRHRWRRCSGFARLGFYTRG